MEDVIIIGAGMAGLAAGLALERAGLSFRILEAGDSPGGRARTRILPSGVPADLGAHWLHGENNDLKAEADRYGIDCKPDQADGIWLCKDGQMQREDMDTWLDDIIRQDLAEAIRTGTHADCALPELGVNDKGREILRNFGLLWNGVEPPLSPSAREFLTDENTPGGQHLKGGMQALISALTAEIGNGRIHLRTSVNRIDETPEGISLQAMDGSVWTARRVIFTASLGVLQSRLIRFTPALSRDFHEQIAGIIMGRVNKIIIELDPAFLQANQVPVDYSLELLDSVPHFCHAHSAGLPLIQLFVCGDQAEVVEALAPDQALAYVRKVLETVDVLRGFDNHVMSPPIVTRWVANPYTRGSYSCCLPSAKRTGPLTERLVTFCGEAFDERFPASLPGAWRSGKAAAEIVTAELANSPVAEPAA